MAERPMACAEWQEDLAGWAVAQLDPAREALLAAHLESCATCRAEAHSLLTVAAVSLAADPDGPVTGAEEPPPELAERIAASIAAERRTTRARRGGVIALASAAAAIAAVIVLQRDSGPPPLQGEEVAFTVVPAGASAHAVIADEERGSLVQLTASGLDPEVTYALWLSPPGGTWDDRVAAGTFRPDEDGDVDVRLRCALEVDEYGRVWATTPDGDIALDTKR